MSNYLKCKICGAPCNDDQIGQPNPYCPEHEEEHRREQDFLYGGGNDPETADPEMESMKSRDVNEDEGDK